MSDMRSYYEELSVTKFPFNKQIISDMTKLDLKASDPLYLNTDSTAEADNFTFIKDCPKYQTSECLGKKNCDGNCGRLISIGEAKTNLKNKLEDRITSNDKSNCERELRKEYLYALEKIKQAKLEQLPGSNDTQISNEACKTCVDQGPCFDCPKIKYTSLSEALKKEDDRLEMHINVLKVQEDHDSQIIDGIGGVANLDSLAGIKSNKSILKEGVVGKFEGSNSATRSNNSIPKFISEDFKSFEEAPFSDFKRSAISEELSYGSELNLAFTEAVFKSQSDNIIGKYDSKIIGKYDSKKYTQQRISPSVLSHDFNFSYKKANLKAETILKLFLEMDEVTFNVGSDKLVTCIASKTNYTKPMLFNCRPNPNIEMFINLNSEYTSNNSIGVTEDLPSYICIDGEYIYLKNSELTKFNNEYLNEIYSKCNTIYCDSNCHNRYVDRGSKLQTLFVIILSDLLDNPDKIMTKTERVQKTVSQIIDKISYACVYLKEKTTTLIQKGYQKLKSLNLSGELNKDELELENLVQLYSDNSIKTLDESTLILNVPFKQNTSVKFNITFP